MIFRNPWILLLIPLVAIFLYIVKKGQKNTSALRFSSTSSIKSAPVTLKIFLYKNLYFLRAAVFILILIALARPQTPLEDVRIHTEGIDIVLAVDASGSMQAEDFKLVGRRQNRLEVVKRVVEEFIRARKSDRIGMIAFAGRAYTVCPLTLDYDWLIENLKRVEIGAIEDGTAIGSAISSSLNRLKDTEAKSKIIILLTDGINNAGKISPITAAEAAKALGVRIYTIGAGTKGMVPFPARTSWGAIVYQDVRIDLDDEALTEIADKTGGQFFRAVDTESLRDIYREIDEMETTPILEEGFQQYEELFPWFLILGMLILILEIVLSHTFLRKIP